VILPVIVRKAGHVFNEIQLLDSKNGTALWQIIKEMKLFTVNFGWIVM
jgi:hypothetical protein